MKKHKRIAIYPGTFDPVTNGHLDILLRASALFDKVIVGVAQTTTKTTIFTIPERISLLQQVISPLKFHCPIQIEAFKGLLVKFAKQKKAGTLVRGLRAISDFEYEFQLALMNRHQASNVETVFLMPDEKYVYLSSSIVRQLGHLNGNLKAFLPRPVLKAIQAKFRS